MHSSRRRTACLLPVSPSMHCSGGAGGRMGEAGPRGYTWSGGVYLVPGGVLGPGGVYLVQGGVPGPRGCTWSQWGCVPGPGGCTWSWGVPGLGGVPGPGGIPGPGGCTWSQGVYLPRHSPTVDRITDACENITLPQLRCGR